MLQHKAYSVKLSLPRTTSSGLSSSTLSSLVARTSSEGGLYFMHLGQNQQLGDTSEIWPSTP